MSYFLPLLTVLQFNDKSFAQEILAQEEYHMPAVIDTVTSAVTVNCQHDEQPFHVSKENDTKQYGVATWFNPYYPLDSS